MKAYKIIVTRTLAESVELTIPARTPQEALDYIERIGLDEAIDNYAEKEDGGDYPAWQFDDYTGDPYIQNSEPPEEVEIDEASEQDLEAPLR